MRQFLGALSCSHLRIQTDKFVAGTMTGDDVCETNVTFAQSGTVEYLAQSVPFMLFLPKYGR
jgi:hypothetical protein